MVKVYTIYGNDLSPIDQPLPKHIKRTEKFKRTQKDRKNVSMEEIEESRYVDRNLEENIHLENIGGDESYAFDYINVAKSRQIHPVSVETLSNVMASPSSPNIRNKDLRAVGIEAEKAKNQHNQEVRTKNF